VCHDLAHPGDNNSLVVETAGTSL